MVEGQEMLRALCQMALEAFWVKENFTNTQATERQDYIQRARMIQHLYLVLAG